MANEHIEIAITAEGRILISLRGKHWPFDDQRRDSLGVEALQQAKKLRRQAKSQEIVGPIAFKKRLLDFKRSGDQIAVVQAGCELPDYTMFFCKQEKARPVDG